MHNNNRKAPSTMRRNEILKEQHHRCYWCGRKFGTLVIKPDRSIYKLVPNWDHYIPFSYTNTSIPDNFVAACVRCNLHKHSFIVTSEEAEEKLIVYLKKRWYKGGWEDKYKYHDVYKNIYIGTNKKEKITSNENIIPNKRGKGTSTKLTIKQENILKFIIKRNNIFTYRDIAEYFKFTTKAAHDHVQVIINKGHMKILAKKVTVAEILKHPK